ADAGPSASDKALAAAFSQNVHVTRDGFEFHVVYRTRFGQNKTEKLETALESFQQMRVFKPHVNMQKSGIRLVVTHWDGESFVEKHGIENVEHAAPQEIEALIKANLIGDTSGSMPIPAAPIPRQGRGVLRIAVVRKGHNARFHLVFHRQDGNT